MAPSLLLLAIALAGLVVTVVSLVRLWRETARLAGLRDRIGVELARLAPAETGPGKWWTVLRVGETASSAEIEAAYDRLAAAARARARRHGEAADLTRLRQARSKALAAIAR